MEFGFTHHGVFLNINWQVWTFLFLYFLINFVVELLRKEELLQPLLAQSVVPQLCEPCYSSSSSNDENHYEHLGWVLLRWALRLFDR